MDSADLISSNIQSTPSSILLMNRTFSVLLPSVIKQGLTWTLPAWIKMEKIKPFKWSKTWKLKAAPTYGTESWMALTWVNHNNVMTKTLSSLCWVTVNPINILQKESLKHWKNTWKNIHSPVTWACSGMDTIWTLNFWLQLLNWEEAVMDSFQIVQWLEQFLLTFWVMLYRHLLH